jgi:hypothetical protein
MADFAIKRNDTAPSLVATLRDAEGVAVNLTGATVDLIMAAATTGTVKVNTAATLTDAANGIVTYNWLAADTSTAGDFNAEFEVTYSGGKKQTFPTDGYIKIVITADLDTQ